MGKLRHTGRGVNRKGHRAPTNRDFTEASCQWVTRGGRVTQQEKVGKHTRRQEQFPATREEKNPAHKGKDHALHSRQTLPALQQTCTEKHTCSHTHRHTIHAHTCRHTDAHTGLPVVDTRASVLSSESTGSRTMPCQTGGGERTSSIPGSISCCRLGRVGRSPGSSYVVIESHQTQGIRNKQTLHNVPLQQIAFLSLKKCSPCTTILNNFNSSETFQDTGPQKSSHRRGPQSV